MEGWHPSRLSVRSALLKLPDTPKIRLERKTAASSRVGSKDRTASAPSRAAATAGTSRRTPQPPPSAATDPPPRPDPTGGRGPRSHPRRPRAAYAPPLPVAQSRRTSLRFQAAMVATGERKPIPRSEGKTPGAAARAPEREAGARRGGSARGAGRGGAGWPPIRSPDPAGLRLRACAEPRRTRSAKAHAQGRGARAVALSRRWRPWRPRGAWEPSVRSPSCGGGAACVARGRFREVKFPLNLKLEVDAV